MKILILRHNAVSFFSEASEIEKKHPKGQWRYFKFINTDSVLGIYENENEGVDAHPDFFKYFLGQFTPFVETKFDIKNFSDFTHFCESLNLLLNENKKILDLSIESLWIWTVEEETLTLSPKLKDYLSY